MNALTKFLGGGAEKSPEAGPSIGKSAPPADARGKMTEAERVELLEVLRYSDQVAAAAEGRASALKETRARLVAEIEEARTEGAVRAASLMRDLRTAEAKTRRYEEQLREASAAEAGIRAEYDRTGRVAELAIATRQKQLVATADPRIDQLRLWLEHEMAANRCYGPPFVPNTPAERRRMVEQARSAPAPDDRQPQFDLSPRDSRAIALNLPFLHGGYDQTVQQALNARSAALKAAHARTHALKLLPLTAAEVTQEIDFLRAGIPPIPADASLNAPLPMTMEVDYSKVLQVRTADGTVEHAAVGPGPREAPKDMPPDGTRYVNGVPQR